MRHPHRKVSGFSLLEALVAAALFILAIAGISAAYSGSIKTLKAADESAVCSENLMQRMDQLRRTSWANATNPTYISTLLTPPLNGTNQNLRALVDEHVTVSAVAVLYASSDPSPQPTRRWSALVYFLMRAVGGFLENWCD